MFNARFKRIGMAAATVALAGLVFSGCTATNAQDSGSAQSQRQQIDAGADATLSRLYEASPDARALVREAKGVLVFPSVVSAGFIVGAQYGKGVLRVGGVDTAYYSTAGGSVGFQAGAQSKAIVVLFMTQDALNKFRNSDGWTAGVDAFVAVATIGANGHIDTRTAQQPVIGFVLNNAGLMAGISLEGTKINKLNL
ncbi:BPSL1445 family SYLF domain-containing lipoprotein [Bordetella avium]|uniref:Lipoprotein n=1 Tax=Bordetella avium (strain 197N) TaxID=360910 RepID=Q2KZP5_BORA1|nr:YSC84-related protein [Bordetella avium]AZY49374.1 twin-arginine translocation pathway signal [Bordetella avium]AZY52727.1 twin-arginine translocation pathway signal [Bordetella avium]RIQ12852.1 twin-arginine translocation pathway signal [Bordetella avium]RIQ19113.1 twin-arginine translocation pathway signal [Bordetella avium]RIQ32024.1 twin-arginine translocation pathway signal [Bordetella avium]